MSFFRSLQRHVARTGLISGFGLLPAIIGRPHTDRLIQDIVGTPTPPEPPKTQLTKDERKQFEEQNIENRAANFQRRLDRTGGVRDGVPRNPFRPDMLLPVGDELLQKKKDKFGVVDPNKRFLPETYGFGPKDPGGKTHIHAESHLRYYNR